MRRRAREVFVHRGTFGPRAKDANVSRIWEVNADGASRRYTIRRDHELLQLLNERLGNSGALLASVLDLIERTVPVERVWLDVTERGAPTVSDNENEVINAAATLVEVLAHSGIPREMAVLKVSAMDPFDKVTDLASKLSAKTRHED